MEGLRRPTLRLHRYVDSANVAVGDEPPAPSPSASLAILPPYPNPVRTEAATLRFTLVQAAHVTLRIHDAAGRLVRELLDDERPAGPHEARWDRRDTNGQPARSGVYFATVEADAEHATTRFLLLQ